MVVFVKHLHCIQVFNNKTECKRVVAKSFD